MNSSKLLAPGGVAVHTTEFNCTSNKFTYFDENITIFRERDICELKARLEAEGFTVEPLDFSLGSDEEDVLFDYEPYYTRDRHHIKLLLCGFVATSILLIIERPQER